MAEKNVIEKLTEGTVDKDQLRYDQERLKGNIQKYEAISYALDAMKEVNKGFLKEYEFSEMWQKINSGLIRHNISASVNNLVEFKLCEANRPQKSYFNPFSKKPITMCYNKFVDKEPFEQTINYNMILFYDDKTKKNMNWNSLEDTVQANVRALNLSKICQRGNRQCFQKQLQTRVFEKQRFKGFKLENLSQVIERGISDTTPISQVIVRQ